MPKKMLIVAFAMLLLAIPTVYAQTKTPEYDPATIAILEEIVTNNFATHNTINSFTDLKTVWSNDSPKQLRELDLRWQNPRNEVFVHDLPYLEKLMFHLNYERQNMGIRLENLPSLKILIVSKSELDRITDVKGLAAITSLVDLDFSENKITKIEGLETLLRIKTLRGCIRLVNMLS